MELEKRILALEEELLEQKADNLKTLTLIQESFNTSNEMIKANTSTIKGLLDGLTQIRIWQVTHE